METECGFKRAETGCIPEYSGKRALRHAPAHTWACTSTHARGTQAPTNVRKYISERERELIRKISHSGRPEQPNLSSKKPLTFYFMFPAKKLEEEKCDTRKKVCSVFLPAL